jgi:hypothetical protein
MLTSTGGHSSMRHSTGATGDQAKRKDHRRPHPRFSTSRASTINHFTGAEPNARRDEEHARAKAGRAAPEKATRWEPRRPARAKWRAPNGNGLLPSNHN